MITISLDEQIKEYETLTDLLNEFEIDDPSYFNSVIDTNIVIYATLDIVKLNTHSGGKVPIIIAASPDAVNKIKEYTIESWLTCRRMHGTSGTYIVKKIPSSGTHIILQLDGNEYPIAIMRWTDGFNTLVERAVEHDAKRIAACLNYCKNMTDEELNIL